MSDPVLTLLFTKPRLEMVCRPGTCSEDQRLLRRSPKLKTNPVGSEDAIVLTNRHVVVLNRSDSTKIQYCLTVEKSRVLLVDTEVKRFHESLKLVLNIV